MGEDELVTGPGRAAAGKKAGLGCLGAVAALLALAWAITAFDPDKMPVQADTAGTREAQTPEPESKLFVSDKEYQSPPLPRGVGPAPVVVRCAAPKETELDHCEDSLKQMIERDWPAAWRGDYQGVRNVGFCLHNGCWGSTIKDEMGACAWRMVLVGSGDDRVNDVDARNLELACGKLTSASKGAAIAKAEATFRRIYGRELP